MLIKEAAKNLFDNNEITLQDYEFIEKHEKEFGEQIEKVARRISPAWEAIRGGAVALGLGTGLAFTGAELYDKLSRQSAINKSFEQMKEKMPILSEYSEDQIKDYFDVIKTFSPKAASNPLVAGALVHKMLEFGGIDHKLVQDISQIESSSPSGFLYDVAKASMSGLAKLPKDN